MSAPGWSDAGRGQCRSPNGMTRRSAGSVGAESATAYGARTRDRRGHAGARPVSLSKVVTNAWDASPNPPVFANETRLIRTKIGSEVLSVIDGKFRSSVPFVAAGGEDRHAGLARPSARPLQLRPARHTVK